MALVLLKEYLILVSAGYYEENISAPKSPRKDKKGCI